MFFSELTSLYEVSSKMFLNILNVVAGTKTSHRSLLEMQILKPHPDLLNQKFRGRVICVLTSSLQCDSNAGSGLIVIDLVPLKTQIAGPLTQMY